MGMLDINKNQKSQNKGAPMRKNKRFSTELEVELLAKKHLEAYLNECNCQSKEDALLAIEKMVGMGVHLHDVVENGIAVPMQ